MTESAFHILVLRALWCLIIGMTRKGNLSIDDAMKWRQAVADSGGPLDLGG